jgi:hypothetical protein
LIQYPSFEVFKINLVIRIPCKKWKQLWNVGKTQEPFMLTKGIDEEMLVNQGLRFG